MLIIIQYKKFKKLFLNNHCQVSIGILVYYLCWSTNSCDQSICKIIHFEKFKCLLVIHNLLQFIKYS